MPMTQRLARLAARRLRDLLLFLLCFFHLVYMLHIEDKIWSLEDTLAQMVYITTFLKWS